MENPLKEKLTARTTWMRALYMLLFAVLYSVAEFVLVVVMLFQFGSRLITGEVNARLLEFSQGLATYIYQIVQFLCFNSEEHPYPLAPWPHGGPAKPRATRGRKAAPATGGQGEGSVGG